jgi:hypothetical protein
MVCYARPASRLAAIMLVAWLVFAMPVRHYFDNAALVMTVTVATAGAVVAAALAFVIFMSVRRRRAAAGGCVSCQFRCQHAMTQPATTGPARLWLVTTADRRPQGPAPSHPGGSGPPSAAPGRSVPVLLPMPAVRSADPAAPRWPDRPAHRASQVSHQSPGPAIHAPPPQRERAGSPRLAAGIPRRHRRGRPHRGSGDQGADGAGIVGHGHMAAAGQHLDLGTRRKLVEVAGLMPQQQQVARSEGDGHRHRSPNG